MKKCLEKFNDKMYLALAMITSTMMMIMPAWCSAIGSAGESAATNIAKAGKEVTKWLVIICLVVFGLVMIIGSQRKKEEAKEGIPQKLIGIACVVGATALGTLIFSWF